MERYYIKTTSYFNVSNGTYWGRHSNIIGKRYLVIRNNKISNIKLIYPQRYEWGLSNSDTITFGKTKFRKLLVLDGETVYPTFSLDSDGVIREVEVYVDFAGINVGSQYDEISFPYRDKSLIVVPEHKKVPINTTDKRCFGFHIDDKYMHGRAVMLSTRFLNRFREIYQCESSNSIDLGSYYSFIYPSLCAYYNDHGTPDGIHIDDFIDYLIDYRMKNYKKRKPKTEPSGYYRYFPELKPFMFEFDGNSKTCFDYVNVNVPLVNPDRGIVKLIDVAREHRIRLYTEVYNKLEEYTGIPKSFFRIDNCMLTRDERLLLVIGIKEVSIQEEEAE